MILVVLGAHRLHTAVAQCGMMVRSTCPSWRGCYGHGHGGTKGHGRVEAVHLLLVLGQAAGAVRVMVKGEMLAELRVCVQVCVAVGVGMHGDACCYGVSMRGAAGLMLGLSLGGGRGCAACLAQLQGSFPCAQHHTQAARSKHLLQQLMSVCALYGQLPLHTA
eukprot:1147447-Pelagomonas_calceolata.AAC.2